MNLLVTGGCGFIGSNFIKLILEEKRNSISKIINLDALTYAGNLDNTKEFEHDTKYYFERADLCDLEKINEIFKR